MQDHIRFEPDIPSLVLLDQRKLPTEEEYFPCRSVDDVITALKVMVVRGAPAIGVTAAWGCVLAAGEVEEQDGWEERLDALLDKLAAARPTAVNLSWAVERMRELWKNMPEDATLADVLSSWKAEADRMQREDVEINRRMGFNGATLVKDGDTILTHCNAGALATAGFGTAVGVVYAAVEQGKKVKVIADETRPFLQGARLTAYELHKAGVPVTVACDNACALLMRKGMVDKVVVGADRIAANGDAANKIGTYGVALLAKAHGIPFYVAAPLSTIDRQTPCGDGIAIEERPDEEVSHINGKPVIPDGVPVYNFAFDVTPAELIDGIITEQGVLRAPYTVSIQKAFEDAVGSDRKTDGAPV